MYCVGMIRLKRPALEGHAPSWPVCGVALARTRRSASLHACAASLFGGPRSVVAGELARVLADATERVPPVGGFWLHENDGPMTTDN